MHSFRKLNSGQYVIGIWVHTLDGGEFKRLFTVARLIDAIAYTNVMNGGDGNPVLSPKLIKEFDENEPKYEDEHGT